MKAKLFRVVPGLVACGVLLFTTGATPSVLAADITWDGGGGNDNWSTPANWSDDVNGLQSGDNITFDSGDAATVGTVNSIIDGSFSVGNLILNPKDNTDPRNDGHTLQIAAGNTLTVNGILRVGDYPSFVANDSWTGIRFQGGGALVVNGDGDVWNGGSSTDFAVLDVRGLSRFIVNTPSGEFSIGDNNRGMGDLYLAASNRITAARLEIGRESNSTPQWNYVRLGATNTFYTDNLYVGTRRLNGKIEFQSGLTNPRLTLRDSTGSGRAHDIAIGDSQAKDGQDSQGIADFSGGTVDILVTNLHVGIGIYNSTTASYGYSGTLTLAAGTIDAIAVRLGWVQNGAASGNTSTGTLNLNGGTLLADSITLADDDAANHDRVRGILNLSGGTLKATTIAKGDGGGTALLNWTNGTLSVETCSMGSITQDVAGVLSPGLTNHLASSRFDADYTLSSGTWIMEVDSPSATNDSAHVTGALDLSGSSDTLDIRDVDGEAPGPGIYVIATYGSRSGTFDTVLGVPASQVVYDYNSANRIAVVIPPKGSSVTVK